MSWYKKIDHNDRLGEIVLTNCAEVLLWYFCLLPQETAQTIVDDDDDDENDEDFQNSVRDTSETDETSTFMSSEYTGK